MRKPRGRFHEFVLLITLASLVTAAFALKASVANREAAHVYATRAYQARLLLEYWEGGVKHRAMRVKLATTAADKAAPHLQADLRRVRSLQTKAVDKAKQWEQLALRYLP